MVGIADFRCCSHLQCLLLPRGLLRRTVFRWLSVLYWSRCGNRTTWLCRICDGLLAIIGTWRAGSTHAQHMKTSVRFQAVGVAMVLSNVHEHSEKDFVFFSLLQKHIKSQMITNEGGRAVSRNMFITMRSRHVPISIQLFCYDFLALPIGVNTFLRANRQYHLNTNTNNAHAPLDGRVNMLKTTHRITRHRAHFGL